MVEVEHSSGRLVGNRELVSRITTDLCTDGTLLTEASGFSELYERPLNLTAPISQNYHSLVQTAAIRDAHTGCASTPSAPQRQLTVLTRRTMAIASLADGTVEYMTMRRISTQSDNQGPWPLDDRKPMHDQVRLMLMPQPLAEMTRFPAALALEEPLVVLFHRGSQRGVTTMPKGAQLELQPDGLPPSVWMELLVRDDAPQNASYVLRLQNVVAGGPSVSVPSLSKALGLPKMRACVETTSTMQQTRDANEAVRLMWRTEGEATPSRHATLAKVAQGDLCTTPVLLDSLDLRTFTFGVEL